MIADGVLEHIPRLDRRGLCVGSIAPDYSIENENWIAFRLFRAVTHWKSGKKTILLVTFTSSVLLR